MSVERAGRLQRCRSTKSRVHACLEANEMAPRFRNYGCMAGASSNFSTWRCHPLLTISPTHATFDPFYLDSRVISRKICCCQCQWRLSPNGISLSLFPKYFAFGFSMMPIFQIGSERMRRLANCGPAGRAQGMHSTAATLLDGRGEPE